ncbi:MAG: hypothetical protein AAB332_00080 [Planctomycetota bacterium]
MINHAEKVDCGAFRSENNQPRYVVLSEERYRELIEAEEELTKDF